MHTFLFLKGSESNAGDERNAASVLSEKCDFMCTLATSAVKYMLERLFSGMLEVKEFVAVYARRNQVEKLCIAHHQDSLSDVLTVLENRNKEYTAFTHHRSQLDSFCRQMETSELQIEGI